METYSNGELAQMEQAGKNAEHCVCCGEIIPEGRQVCPICEKATPTADVVEVVRCKDCTWASRADNGELRCGHDNRGLYFGFVPENWFCADGLRKETKDE